MGKNTDKKLKKVLAIDELERMKEKQEIKKKKRAPKKKPKSKIVTETKEFQRTTVILVVLFVVIGGIGIYFKIIQDESDSESIQTPSTNFFGEGPKPDDNMLEPKILSKKMLSKYTWRDNPLALAKRFEIMGFFRSSIMSVRIKDKQMDQNNPACIGLYTAGSFLAQKQYRIIDIQDPVVFLSDKDGKIHRLVDKIQWNNAALVFNWKKNIFGNPEEVVVNPEDDGMTAEQAKITFGDFELVNPTDEQIKLLRDWETANPDYSFEDFQSKCSELGVVYQHNLPATMGGMLVTRPDEVDENK